MHSSQLHSRFRTACKEEKALPPLMVSMHELVQPREELNSGRGRMQEIFSTKRNLGNSPGDMGPGAVATGRVPL